VIFPRPSAEKPARAPWTQTAAAKASEFKQVLLSTARAAGRMEHEVWAHGGAVACATLVLWVGVFGPVVARDDPRERAREIARLSGGDFGETGLAVLAGRMDRAAVALAARFAPEARTVEPSALTAALAPAISPEPTLSDAIQPLPEDAARLVNASIPVSALPNPAARPFFLKARDLLDESRAVECLTAAIYYEAGYESTAGQQAVAQVVLNRMRHPSYPKTVCGVVFQGSNRTTGCQFTFTCDGSLARRPAPAVWERARKIAVEALNGKVMKSVGNATHYHANYVVPYWASSLAKVTTIGTHIFYRWNGGAGAPGAFGGTHAGAEPTIDQLLDASLQNASVELPKGQEKPVLALASFAPGAEEAPEAPSPVVTAPTGPLTETQVEVKLEEAPAPPPAPAKPKARRDGWSRLPVRSDW